MKTFQRSVLAIWICTIKLSEQSIAGITYKDDFDFRNRYEDVQECDPLYWHPLHMPDHCLKMYEKVIRSKVSSIQPIRLVKDKQNSDMFSNLVNGGVKSAQDPDRSNGRSFGHSHGRSYKHSGRRSRRRLRKRSHTDSHENRRMQDKNHGNMYNPVNIHISLNENKKENTLHGMHTIIQSDEINSDSDEDKHADKNKDDETSEENNDEGEVWQEPKNAQEYALANEYEPSDGHAKENADTQAEVHAQAITLVQASKLAQSYELEPEDESSQADESAESDESVQAGVLAHPDQYELSDGYLQPSFSQADGFAKMRNLRANSNENESEDISELYDDEESSKSSDNHAKDEIYGELKIDYNGFSPMRSRRKNNKKYVTGYLSSMQSEDLYSLRQSQHQPLTPHEQMLGMVSKDAKNSPIVPALGFLPQLGLSTLYRLPVSGKTVNMIEKVSRNYAKSIQDTYAQAGIFPATETENTTRAQLPEVNKSFINELKDKIQGIVARRKNDITKNSTREANIDDNNKSIKHILDNNNETSNSSKTIKRRHKKRKRKRRKKKHKKRKKKKKGKKADKKS